eukprot:SAG22_NODE_9658_length_576_cov_1.081761_1_plen_92_part_00
MAAKKTWPPRQPHATVFGPSSAMLRGVPQSPWGDLTRLHEPPFSGTLAMPWLVETRTYFSPPMVPSRKVWACPNACVSFSRVQDAAPSSDS